RKALARELEWAKMAPRARVAKSKARLSAYEKLASQEYEEKEDELVLQIPPGPHLGDIVVRAERVRKGYGDNLLMEDLNFDLPRGGVSRFNFKGPDQQRKVGELSGGERNRVHLAKLLRRGGNLLLLDEPTNDLDVDTLRSLEEALLNFGGCAVVISHDRWFLDR